MKDLHKIRCFSCNQFEQYSSNFPDKKEKKPNVEGSTSVEDYAPKFEQEFSLASFNSNVDSSSFHYTLIIDSGLTRHMTLLYGVFQSINESGPSHFLETNIESLQEEV